LNVWLDLPATIWKECAEISIKDLAIDGLPPEIRDEKILKTIRIRLRRRIDNHQLNARVENTARCGIQATQPNG
jgi:hypothetical protein